MFTFRFPWTTREGDPSLTDTQRALVDHKFAILQRASFDLKSWTDTCTDELRRNITSVAPSHVRIALLEFRALRCVSLQCLPLALPADELAADVGDQPARSSMSMERTRPDRTAAMGP
jgi:hypothetical protein